MIADFEYAGSAKITTDFEVLKRALACLFGKNGKQQCPDTF